MYNILVTGVGAVIGYGIIRSLRKSKFDVNIIGIDIYEDAIGQVWCDKFFKGILAKDEKFKIFLKQIIEENKIDLVIPGIEQDLNRIANDFDFLKTLPTKYAINNPKLIKIFNDKWETYCFFANAGINLIPTFIEGDFDELKKITCLPMLLKPKQSYASKGIYKIYNKDDFSYWQKKLGNNFMVQKFIDNENSEYTISIFGLGNGNYTNSITLKRKLGPDGATAKAEVIFDSEIDNYINSIVKFSKPIGPTNIQLIKDLGKCFLLEINPRISSSTSIREHFGINEAEMCIEYYLENKIPEKKVIKPGKIRRYLEDLITYDSDHC
ncbi:MAG: ATP-grasp domain-containing protein [Chloroflexi bacterium]|nr:ATP-grasp domain-containing protein [Chloroflexota bacterium]